MLNNSPRLILLFLLLPVLIWSKDMKINYQVNWQFANSHYFVITLTLENPEKEVTLFRIPAWRPGRYTIENFTKNVVHFKAFDADKKPLPFRKLDKDTWEVTHGKSGKVSIQYQYYANELDAGNSYLDDSEAYLNPINLMMYIPGKESLPVSVQLQKPDGWGIATALNYNPVKNEYFAADYHELADSPILISPDMELLSFSIAETRFEIVLQGKSNLRDREKLIDDFRRLINEQVSIFEGVFPFDRYLFLIHLVDRRYGHGVEHKNSTSMVMGPADFQNGQFYQRLISFAAHEFFHVWNVERITPAVLSPPDYSRENYTTQMWFFEGVTSYYEKLTLCRSGLISKYAFYNNLERQINGFTFSAGRKVASPAMTSWDSWGRVGGNPPGTVVSFYRSGEVLGLLLDLEIRGRTGNEKSLDDVLRYLYKEYALKDKGVPEGGIEKAINTVTGSNFRQFFADYVEGMKEIGFNAYLTHAGLSFSPAQGERPLPFSGIITTSSAGESRIRNVIDNSPAMKAGLAIDDMLVAIDHQRATHENFNKLLAAYQPGEKILISVFRRNQLMQKDLVLEKAQYPYRLLWQNENATEAQLKLRAAWLKE